MQVLPLLIASSLTAGSCLLTAAAFAEDKVIREYSFDVTDIQELQIHASVGSIDIMPTEGSEIKLVLEIKGQKQGWFRRDKDVSEVELDSLIRGDRLILEQTEDDTNTEWTIHMPVMARTDIQLGVGAIVAEFGVTELEIELGVGDIDIKYPKSGAATVELSVGVGDASLRGTSEIRTTKSFVSHDIIGYGDGDKDIDVHVGVGDIDLRLF